MKRTKHRLGRATGCILVIGVVLGILGTITYQQPDWAFVWWKALRGMMGRQATVEARPQLTSLDRARVVQRRLRDYLAELEIQRQELDGRLRLLEIRPPLAIERDHSDDEERKRRSQRDAYARQLVEVQTQIEAAIAILRRVDRLVQELEIGAVIDQADGNLLQEAAELLWTADLGRTGPNALIPDSDWSEP